MPGRPAWITVALAALAASSPLAAQGTATPGDSVAQRLLAAQNAERTRLGLKPLAWSAKLADHAKKWAQTLAAADKFEHAPAGTTGGEGENLWTGTRGDYAPEDMIGAFVDEGKLFKRGVFPAVSTNGRWEDVGHYTQLIWKDTREVGCALASNATQDVLVCRYFPAGNVVGQPVFDYTAPVQKPGASPGASGNMVDVVLPKPAPTKVSPSAPKKRASRRHRRGG